MVLTDEKVAAFQNLYKARFGKDLTKEEAYEKGIKLLRLVSLVYKPITKTSANNPI